MRAKWMTAVAAAVLSFAPANAAAPSKLFVFGDSLVDPGNVWIGSGFVIPPASQGYFQGRFTNGPDWTDLLNQRLYGSLTTPFLAGGTNYAVGGARAASDAIVASPLGGTATLPGLVSQGGFYVAQQGPAIDPSALYIISFGNNDATALRTGDTYLVDYTINPAGTIINVSSQVYTQAFVANIAGAAALALQGGARVFVGGVPKPDDPTSIALQGALDAALNPLTSVFGDRLIRYSYADAFAAMRADPTRFGLDANTNFGTGPQDTCLANRSAVNGMIDCTGYFSFDGTHPTRQVHEALYRRIAPLIGVSIPEPASWAMMIIGFGAAGAAVRRRRAPATA